MANWSLPTLTSDHDDHHDELLARDVDAATLFSAAPSNTPANAIRYNRSTDVFEEWSGAAWVVQPIAIAGLEGGSAAAFRTALGLGTMATQNSGAVNISGGTLGGNGNAVTNLNAANLTGTLASAIMTQILQAVFPVGSVFTSRTNSANPNTILGFGTWVAIAGKTIVGYQAADPDFGTVGATPGAKTHTLVIGEIPIHNHNFQTYSTGGAGQISVQNSGRDATPQTVNLGGVQNAGGGGAHNNIQPSYVLYMWERTA